ncbi:hypothetical protein CYY_003663 [Polysphondylium violaceum]|uniref:Endonuclease III homolog n=1 Tax=Polysphondylium violaceum TaxID=133409 RepID=A0A8J4Q6I7_9MYCE|nr:hypothetical protein CYY_003663 [Polysphondylium violaceum]
MNRFFKSLQNRYCSIVNIKVNLTHSDLFRSSPSSSLSPRSPFFTKPSFSLILNQNMTSKIITRSMSSDAKGVKHSNNNQSDTDNKVNVDKNNNKSTTTTTTTTSSPSKTKTKVVTSKEKEITEDDKKLSSTKNTKKRKVIEIEYEEDSNKKKEKEEESESESESESDLEVDDKNKESLARIHWKQVWDKIGVMRAEQEAPVDWAGASSFDDHSIDAPTRRFHILVGCLLSSQTKDQITHAAMVRLKKHGLTVENVIKTPNETLSKLIHPVGFYQRKAVYLKNIASILKSKYKSDVPDQFDQLMDLPGLGPKMTHLILQIAFDKVEGIAIDVHMHRIMNRMKWVHNTNTPEETRKELESWLPKDRWRDVNHLIVGFGQTVCLPTTPKCQNCTINDLCPTGIANMKANARKESKKQSKVKVKSKSISSAKKSKSTSSTKPPNKKKSKS